MNDPNVEVHSWVSDSKTDYIFMSIKQRKEEELEVAGTKLAFKFNGHSTQFWVDSGSPIPIFIIGDLKRTLGKQNVQLQPIDPKGDQFREYRNNPLKLMESWLRPLLHWMDDSGSNICNSGPADHQSSEEI